MPRAERSGNAHRQDDRPPQAPEAPIPPVLALQQAGVGNQALSRWLLQREPQTFEQAAAELGAIDEEALTAPSSRQLMGDVIAELGDWEAGGDPMVAIDAIDKKRKRIDARLLADIQRDVLAARRAQDELDRTALETRAAAASTQLDVAHTAAATALKVAKTIRADYAKYPFMQQENNPAKAAMDAAKAAADEKHTELTPLGATIKTARGTLETALGTAARTTAATDAESVAKDVAAKAAAASTVLAPHLEALTKLTTRASGEERQAAKEAALALGLPTPLANKILSADLVAPKGDIEQRLTAAREEHQSVPGATLVTRVFGMGITHSGANTAGYDTIGRVNGKNVHLTLYWDQVTQTPINLNQTDDTILGLTLGTTAYACMHVTAEAFGKADNRNPSYFWRGAKKNMGSAAAQVGVTAAELESQLKGLCEGMIADFKARLVAKRNELGARPPAPPLPPP